MTSGSIQFVQVLVSALVALLVTTLTHLFTGRRDRENKRREQRLNYLVSAYRALSKANHHPRLHEVGDELQQAIADIQLFGTPEQIRLAQQFARDLGTKQAADLDELFIALRDNLRAELRAEPVSGKLLWLRIENDEKPYRKSL
jgi:hypothetical protein